MSETWKRLPLPERNGAEDTRPSRWRRPPREVVSAAALAALLLLAGASRSTAGADCGATLLLSGRSGAGDLIVLRARPGLSRRHLARAVDHWETCPNYGLDFPAFVTERDQEAPVAPVRTLTVEYHPRSQSAACGRFRGNEVHVYSFAVDARGTVRSCGSLPLVLAHELGHVLGLADGSPEDGCRYHMMADIDEFNRYERWPHETECRAVGRRWLTAVERRASGPEE